MAKGATSQGPSRKVKALLKTASAVPDGLMKVSSKEPSTLKQKERNATLLGLRMIGAPAVAFLKGLQSKCFFEFLGYCKSYD